MDNHYAVAAVRVSSRDGLDDFPTPGWAVRALLERVLADDNLEQQICLEPACGRGHMARVLAEHFGEVRAADVADYGAGYDLVDCLAAEIVPGSVDWLVTNPPFVRAEHFVLKGLLVARVGVALLCRLQFLEGIGRFRRLFEPYPPAIIAPFVERVVMLQGRLDPHGSTATSYAWFIWRKGHQGSTKLRWISPCRSLLERQGDYD